MKPYKWRTKNNSAVYVDSATGSDTFGNGTMQNPYQTLGKAWRGHTTLHPATIICRGTFCEDMADGTHRPTISGDYYGAAVFDGADKYTMYGFRTPNMIFRNCAYGTYETTVYGNSSPLFAGVGLAMRGDVGDAYLVFGVYAPSVMLAKSALYWGAVGGSDLVKVGVASPKPNPNHPFWFMAYHTHTLMNLSVYDVPIEHRGQQLSGSQAQDMAASIFGKCAFYINDAIRFHDCVFASDCRWFDCEGNEFVPSGATGAERVASLQEWIDNTTIPNNAATKNKIKLIDCILTDKTSWDIWNNPDAGDLTLKLENADEELVNGSNYKGAFPPAMNVPVLSESAGVPGTWDETTACGLVSVADDRIVIGGGSSAFGEIKSKVIVTDPDKVAVAGIFAQYSNQFATEGIQLHEQTPAGDDYVPSEVLPVGRYVLRGGNAVYQGVYVCEGDVIVVSEENTAFTKADDSKDLNVLAHEIMDANVIDNIWLRACPRSYAMIKSEDGLQAGGTYLNIFDKYIMYRGRRVVPGESFEAENDTDVFTCEGDADYYIAVVFDDTRVPEQPWIPAQLWGEYFAGREGRVYQTDASGQYLGSGNYMCWQPGNEGGYLTTVARTRAQARYIQLRITATRE